MSRHFPGSKASVHIVIALEDKHCNNKCLPHTHFCFLLAFIVEWTSYGVEYSFGQLGSAILVMYHPKTLPTPSLLGDSGGML